MREIHLIFEGNGDRERKAADLIQEMVFQTLKHYEMDVRSFVNQGKGPKQKVAIGTPEEVGAELEIPEFLKRQ